MIKAKVGENHAHLGYERTGRIAKENDVHPLGQIGPAMVRGARRQLQNL